MDTILNLYAPAAGTPKYRALSRAIERAVANGMLAPGDQLPPVRDLAWRLGITPGTVARAYTLLTETGQARAEVGRGTFLADPTAGQVPPPKPWGANAAQDSRIPARTSLYEDPAVLESVPHYGEFYDVIVNARPRPVTPYYAEVSELIRTTVNAVLARSISVDQALEQMQTGLEDIVAN